MFEFKQSLDLSIFHLKKNWASKLKVVAPSKSVIVVDDQ
jgi:hypothetical protein